MNDVTVQDTDQINAAKDAALSSKPSDEPLTACQRYYRKNRDRIAARRAELYRLKPDKTNKWLLVPGNKERHKQMIKDWAARNREHLRAKRQAPGYKEHANARQRAWYALKKQDPAFMATQAEKRRKRRVVELEAMPQDYNAAMVDGLYLKSARLSRCLGVQHNVDHIQPLIKGGTHHHLNMQVIPASINKSKQARADYVLPFSFFA